MNAGGLVLLCIVGYVWGAAIGCTTNNLDDAVNGLRDALVQVATMVTHGLRGLVSWRP